MAAAYADYYAKKRGIELTAVSAGLSAFEDDDISGGARHALAQLGLSPLSDRPTRFNAALAQVADKILVMSEQHLDFIRARFPQFAAKTSLLGDGIPDPFGKSDAAYRECLEKMKPYIEAAVG